MVCHSSERVVMRTCFDAEKSAPVSRDKHLRTCDLWHASEYLHNEKTTALYAANCCGKGPTS